MTIRNLTPYEIVILDGDDEVIARYPAEPVDTIDGIPIVRFGDPAELPGPQPDVSLIVSLGTVEAARGGGRHTSDLLVTADRVHDDHGRAIGWRALGRV